VNMGKTIGITGGKGGTGKSTVATALAYELAASNNVLLVDADVDCPNDHIILSIKRKVLKIIEQRIPRFDLSICHKCGLCAKMCKTSAIASLKGNEPIFMENQCNGCGACKLVCPSNAISWNRKEIGRIFKGNKDRLHFLSGELKPNQPISEFLVNSLNEVINEIKELYDYIIIDTAAGCHCPVVAALEMTDEVIAVTEPTPLGAHDLEIILQLLKKMNKASRIVLNRADIGGRKEILDIADKYGSKLVFEIPFSKEIIDSYSKAIAIKIKDIRSIITREV